MKRKELIIYTVFEGIHVLGIGVDENSVRIGYKTLADGIRDDRCGHPAHKI